MAKISAEEEQHIREAIGVIIEHGPVAIGLAGALAQWLSERKSTMSFSPEATVSP